MPPMNHDDGREVFLELVGVLDSIDLPFFLMQGTALGAYRDGGFTPTESDIDLGFLFEHFAPKADLLAHRLEVAGFTVTRHARPFNHIRTIKAVKNGIRCDLVSWLKWKNKRFQHNLDQKTRPYCIVHDAAMLEKYETAVMFGAKFNIPSPADTYMEREYGPDWLTPADDSVSRTRDYKFMDDERIPTTLVDSPYLKNAIPVERLDQTYRDNYYWYLKSSPFRQKLLTPLSVIINSFGHACLDCGCGEGWLADYVAVPYTGFDSSQVAIERARHIHSTGNFLIYSMTSFAEHQAPNRDYGTIVFGNLLDTYVKPEMRVPLLEKYLRFNPKHIIVYDLERLDHQPISERFKLVEERHVTVGIDIQEVKKHRKILVYEVS